MLSLSLSLRIILLSLFFTTHFPPMLKAQCPDVTLELGIHVDYEAYNNYGGNKTQIIQDVQTLIGIAEAWFETNLPIDLEIVIIGDEPGIPIIWETPDPFPAGTNPIGSTLNGDWNRNRPCVPKDGIFLFAGGNKTGGQGGSTGDVCDDPINDVRIAWVDRFGTVPLAAHDRPFTHEIGHLLGASELEQTPCEDECNGGNSLLMCTSGTGSNLLSDNTLAQCSFDDIMAHIEENCDCFGPPEPMMGDCNRCMETVLLEADNENPVPDCSGLDIINYKATFCNSCDPQELKLWAQYDADKVEILSHDFDGIEIPHPQSQLENLSSTINFAGEECITLEYSAKVKSGVTTSIGSKLLINESSLVGSAGESSIIPIAVGIGGPVGTTTSLLSLINNLTMLPSGTSCLSNNTDKRRFQVSGTLEIDVPYCLKDYRLMMKPGSKIIVKAGNSLEIKGDTKIFACDQMWQGITLEENADLTIDNSTIEDAQYAIKATGNSDISITGSTFNRNFIGVYVENPYAGSGYAGNTNFTALSGNTFDGSGGLLSPYSGQGSGPAGALGSEAFAGIYIDNSSAAIHSLGNSFKDMSNGIYCKGTSLKVTGCTFANIQENGSPGFTGYGILATDRRGSKLFQQSGFGSGAGSVYSFQNCSRGIYVSGMPVDYIKDNRMRVDRGIELVWTQQKANVTGNDIILDKGKSVGIAVNLPSPAAKIAVADNGVEMNSLSTNSTAIQYNAMGLDPQGSGLVSFTTNDIILGAPGNRGIALTSTNSALVQQNNVTLQAGATACLAFSINNDYNSLFNCNDAIGIDAGDGIGFDVWDAESTKYHCNDFADMTTGVYFRMGSPSEDNFRENEFGGGNVGLRIGGSAAIGPQAHKGNTWSGGFGSFGAEHESIEPLDWQLSLFTVHTGTGTDFHPSLPSGQSGPTGWFDTDFSGIPNDNCSGFATCVLAHENPNGDNGLLILDGSIVNGNFQVSEYQIEVGWLAKRYTYRKLAKDPSLIVPGSIYETFYNNESNTPVGQFTNVQLSASNIFDIDSTTVASLENELANIGTGLEAIGTIDSQLAIIGYDSLLVQQRGQFVQNVSNAESNLEAQMAPILAQRLIDADAVAVQNSNIIDSLLLETNKKVVNDIYLNTVAKDSIEFDATQLADLQSIAGQCPLIGGSAVYEARSMLSLVQDSIYDDALSCSVQGYRVNDDKGATQINGFALFPNPAKDQVTLIVPDDISTGQVIFANAQGTIVLQKEITEESQRMEIGTGQLARGIYLLNVFDKGKNIFSEKLIIVH